MVSFSRLAEWDRRIARELLVEDRLGCPLDPAIKYVVAAFRTFGFPSNNSCQGHPKRGRPYPWVRFGVHAEELMTKGSRRPAKDVIVKATRINEKAHKRLAEYLARFYKTRRDPLDEQLTTVWAGAKEGHFELINYGANFMHLVPLRVRSKMRVAFRQEMYDFAAFLRDSYFRGEW